MELRQTLDSLFDRSRVDFQSQDAASNRARSSGSHAQSQRSLTDPVNLSVDFLDFLDDPNPRSELRIRRQTSFSRLAHSGRFFDFPLSLATIHDVSSLSSPIETDRERERDKNRLRSGPLTFWQLNFEYEFVSREL